MVIKDLTNIVNNDKFSKFIKNKYFILFLFFVLICLAVIILYSTGFIGRVSSNLIHPVPINSVNTITSTNHYAYGENIGWIDFSPSSGHVMIGDNGLSGSAWSSIIGWIKLGNDNGPPYLNTSTSDWGVNNNGGNLSGYAYAENIGWINFGSPTIVGRPFGVSIDSSGNFSGYAYSENTGWISFSGNGYKVYTDWRAQFPINGTCGTAATTYAYGTTDFGTGTFCTTGDIDGGVDPVFPASGSSVSWTCDGINDGQSASCTASVSPNPGPQPINGACGTTDGLTIAIAPTANLCTNGTASEVSGAGPWTWLCAGINGGTSSSCSADKGASATVYMSVYALDQIDAANISATMNIVKQFIEQNSTLKLDYNVISSTDNHSYTNWTCAGDTNGCVTLGINDVSSGVQSQIAQNSGINAVGFFYDLNGKTPLQAGSTYGPNMGAPHGSGNSLAYFSIPADIWWFNNNPYQGFSTRAGQIATHETINVIQSTVEDLYGCNINYQPTTDYAYNYERDRLNLINTHCKNALINSFQISTPIIAPPTIGTGGGNLYLLNSNMSRTDILNYVSLQLKKMKTFILQNPALFAQPTTPPPSILHPIQPPPTAPTENGNSLIAIFQKILQLLSSLLNTIPNK